MYRVDTLPSPQPQPAKAKAATVDHKTNGELSAGRVMKTSSHLSCPSDPWIVTRRGARFRILRGKCLNYLRVCRHKR